MSTAIIPSPSADLAWTPEALKEEVEREKALRVVVIDYYQSQLRAGHHYYNLPGQEKRKPALAKEGALNLCSLFKVVPEPAEPHETLTPDGHYTVRYRYALRAARTGQVVATGDGSCSTREAKYAYRWEFARGRNTEGIAEKKIKTRNGWQTQYRFPNADLADAYNTVLKMASKRALVDASLKLPLVSELFTQDLEEQIADRDHESEAASVPEGAPANVDTETGEVVAPAKPQADAHGSGGDGHTAPVGPTPPAGENVLTPDARLRRAAEQFHQRDWEKCVPLVMAQVRSRYRKPLADLTDEETDEFAEEIEGLILSRGQKATVQP